MQLYGSLVGMFELNNLALAVPAPVARYKDMLLHPVESGVDVDAAAAALQEVQPLLDALGDDADAPAEVSLLLLCETAAAPDMHASQRAVCSKSRVCCVLLLREVNPGRGPEARVAVCGTCVIRVYCLLPCTVPHGL
jgi:hypothetical protein